MARLLSQQVEPADGSVCVHSEVTSRLPLESTGQEARICCLLPSSSDDQRLSGPPGSTGQWLLLCVIPGARAPESGGTGAYPVPGKNRHAHH